MGIAGGFIPVFIWSLALKYQYLLKVYFALFKAKNILKNTGIGFQDTVQTLKNNSLQLPPFFCEWVDLVIQSAVAVTDVMSYWLDVLLWFAPI